MCWRCPAVGSERGDRSSCLELPVSDPNHEQDHPDHQNQTVGGVTRTKRSRPRAFSASRAG
jgi:hypothetical protein